MALFPFGPRVVVADPPGDGEKTGSGLFIPESSQVTRTRRGVVVETVPEEARLNEAWKLERGDVVHYLDGYAIGDLHVVDFDRIVACERD
jgi:co-chaperonin GroES (HSP10)